ncbi:hypothetical protein QUB70_02575 [Microcoleus sp. A003_D6]
MPIPQEKITLVGRASCPSHQLMKGFLQEVYLRFETWRFEIESS